jgi:Mitochondrial small ribosomal subunit Rsm22
MKKKYPFPSYIQAEIDRIFSEKKWSRQAKSLAEDVLQLSDFYIHNPDSPTPWEKEWAQRAGLIYFWPLNSLRLLKIKEELANQNFFAGLNHMIDYGAGTATASWLFKDLFAKQHLLERSSIPQNWFPQFRWSDTAIADAKSLTVFSYSLTELSEMPSWSLDSEALLIMDPSTQQDGRKLLELRQQLIEKDYFAWAPCPHQLACPLLTQSKTDWCHDRIHIEKPAWFEDMEKYLPMKNNTLTFSYLALRKTPPPERKWARLVGDHLKEKGKSRQLICRGSDREYLSWMHRNGEPPEYNRGDRVIVDEFEKKSNELRSPKVRLDF